MIDRLIENLDVWAAIGLVAQPAFTGRLTSGPSGAGDTLTQ